MANGRCATCKHFGKILAGEGESVTVCEREGPKLMAQPMVNDGQVVWPCFTGWPQVGPHNGCGYHQPDILIRN